MGVSCVIIVTDPPEGVHKAGEIVNGILQYAVDETTEYKNISVSLIGKAEFHITKGTGDDSRNYYGKEYYIQQTINVLNKRPHETVTIPFGSYKFPFEFHLPCDIPSSYSGKSQFGTDIRGAWEIKYCIKALFEKSSLLSINKTFEKNLIIYGSVNPIAPESPITYTIQKNITRINPLSLFTGSGRPKVIHLKATIANSYLTPGETIKLTYEVHNDTEVNIKTIIATLKERKSFTNSGITNTLEKDIKDCKSESRSISKNTKTYIEVSLPTKPELYSIQHSKIINVEYFARITVDLPLPHMNASIEIPIAIGEKRGHGALDILELSDDDNDIDPPTYKQAVSEDSARFQDLTH